MVLIEVLKCGDRQVYVCRATSGKVLCCSDDIQDICNYIQEDVCK